MKKLLVIAAVALCAALPSIAKAQLKQGPEYVYRAQVVDFSYKNTLAKPELVGFPICAMFHYDIQSGESIIPADSGPNLNPPLPSSLTVDLMATPTTPVTFEYGGKSYTMEYGAIVAAFSQLIADQRALQVAKAKTPAPPSP